MRIVTYSTLVERQDAVNLAERQGEVMLHDEIRDGAATLVFGTMADLPPEDPVLPPTAKELEGRRIRQAAQDDTLTTADRDAGLKLLLEQL